MTAHPSSLLFAAVPPGCYGCVVCDYPRHFTTYSQKGQGRSPSRHYATQAAAQIAELQLPTVLARDAWLFCWWPDPAAPEIPEVMRALGFAFSGKAFTWVKQWPRFARVTSQILTDEIESTLALGCGLTTRKNTESCWLGRRGKPRILSRSVREVVVAPRREHSRKPDEFYARVERFCAGPRLDLFGRQSRLGWVVYGDQATQFDRLGDRQQLADGEKLSRQI